MSTTSNKLEFNETGKQYSKSLTIDLFDNNKKISISCYNGNNDDYWESEYTAFYLKRKEVQKLIKHLQELETKLT